MVMAAELAQSMTYPTSMEIAAATTTEEALVEEAAAGRPAGVTSPSDDAILRRKRHNQRHRRYSAHGSGVSREHAPSTLLARARMQVHLHMHARAALPYTHQQPTSTRPSTPPESPA